MKERACPECGKDGVICWGWAEVYYDLVCPAGHMWTVDIRRGKVVGKKVWSKNLKAGKALYKECKARSET